MALMMIKRGLLRLNYSQLRLLHVSRANVSAVNVKFILPDGTKKNVTGAVGEHCLELAHKNGIELEGACEASLACSTCHVYVESPDKEQFISPATEEEDDLLDMAPFLKSNSRLGCQIVLSNDLEGLVLRLPKATRNFYVDGHKPQPH